MQRHILLPLMLSFFTTCANANPPVEIAKLEGLWVVERLGQPGLEVGSARAQSKNGSLLISSNNFIFAKITVRPDGDVLKGTALLSGSDALEVKVEIHIKEDGTIMEAVPDGFRNLEIWMFRRSAFDH